MARVRADVVHNAVQHALRLIAQPFRAQEISEHDEPPENAAKNRAARTSFWLGIALWLAAGSLAFANRPHTSGAYAQALPISAQTNNPYWAGFVSTDHAPFIGVSATWTVPAVSCGPGSANGTVYAWIGEGGYVRGLASPLIQVGTASDCLDSTPRYHAFYEWYPGIYATDYPLAVHPGDTIAASVRREASGLWELNVRDLTTHMASFTSTVYNADTSSAEFIVERPTVCGPSEGCAQINLTRFNQITFNAPHALTVSGETAVTPTSSLAIALQDAQTGRRLALPAKTAARTNSLSVLWRRAH